MRPTPPWRSSQAAIATLFRTLRWTVRSAYSAPLNESPELATHLRRSFDTETALLHRGVLPCRYVLRQAVDPDVLERWLTPAEGGERGGSGGSTLLKLRAGEISIHDCREQSSAAPLRTACCTSNHMVQPVVGHAHLITLLDDRLRRNRPRLGCQPLGSFSLRAQYDILSD